MSVVPRQGLPGTNYERTFIAVKPDGVQRGLVGNILQRFENKGYKLVALKMLTPTKELAEGHYKDLAKKPFFGGLVKYFSSGPICAMVWEGVNAIAQGRTLLGATNPKDSAPGTIRGDLCVDIGRNICHGSDGPDSAAHEIQFWFEESEVASYTSHSHSMLYEKGAPVKPAGKGKGGDEKKKKEKKPKAGKAAPKVDPAVAAKEKEKKDKACIKEGGKKGQDLSGMAAFGCHYFLTTFIEPDGDLDLLQLCMQGANKVVDPEGDDRKGGAGDIAKIFFSAGDTKLSMVCHVPVECTELSCKDFFAPVLTLLTKPKVVTISENMITCEVDADPDAGVFTLKLRDVCIAKGFEFLRSKGLILEDEDSDDDIDFAAASGIDLNAGADGSDY